MGLISSFAPKAATNGLKAMEKLTELLNRKYQSLQVRSGNHLAHILLTTLVRIPPPWQFAVRNILFKRFPALFADNPIYQEWVKANQYFLVNLHPHIEMIDLASTPALQMPSEKKIAIQIHIFYPELAEELAHYLKDFPTSFDLLISTPDGSNEASIRTSFANLPNLHTLHLCITPNRGRDLAPLLIGFGKQLLEYDYIAHLHTKKSAGTNLIGDAWRQYLYQGLLDCSNGRMTKILGLLDRYGLIYPQKFPLIDVQNCQWGDNYARANALFETLGIPAPEDGYIEFPVGTMFWANVKALKPLLTHSFAIEDFELESGQTDNTLMHALERSFTHIALSQGYRIGILPYPSSASYYP
jgi:lipopolysaccharide biosynthesis protein